MKIKKFHGDSISRPGALHRHIDKCGDPVRQKIKRRKAKEREHFQNIKSNESSTQLTLSKKESESILRAARMQQKEIEDELCGSHENPLKSHCLSNMALCSNDVDTDLVNELVELNDPHIRSNEEIIISEQDERILDLFMSRNPCQRRTLADLIQEKLDERDANLARATDNPVLQHRIDQEILDVYKEVGQILSRYRSGKLPKAFKALPALENWEALVVHTHPENWTAASVFQATRIFASKLNSKLAERFYESILLHRIRDDIAQYKTLNHYLTMAVRKSTIKPAAFFKGIVFPLCLSKDCTLREAVIMCSIIARCSIPIMHCGAALYKLCSMPYGGVSSLFIKTLLDKGYALHYRVIDVLVEHFVSFKEESRLLPVIWHQSLLSLVKGYAVDLSPDQRDALLSLLDHQNHHQMGVIIKEALQCSIKSKSDGVLVANEPDVEMA